LKTIAREIHEADADYVLALKANHEVLHEEIQSFRDDALDHPAHLPAASRHQSVEKDHGRIETRRYLCAGQLDWLSVGGQWAALRSVAVGEAERTVGAKTTRERRHYLSSLPPEAPALARAIRRHGSEHDRGLQIEVDDVLLREEEDFDGLHSPNLPAGAERGDASLADQRPDLVLSTYPPLPESSVMAAS
jgi:hypothetical protein